MKHPPFKKHGIPNALRKQVFERDAYRCVDCGDWHDLTVDHVYPESLGGLTVLQNLATRCRPCNCRKGRRPSFNFWAVWTPCPVCEALPGSVCEHEQERVDFFEDYMNRPPRPRVPTPQEREAAMRFRQELEA